VGRGACSPRAKWLCSHGVPVATQAYRGRGRGAPALASQVSTPGGRTPKRHTETERERERARETNMKLLQGAGCVPVPLPNSEVPPRENAMVVARSAWPIARRETLETLQTAASGQRLHFALPPAGASLIVGPAMLVGQPALHCPPALRAPAGGALLFQNPVDRLKNWRWPRLALTWLALVRDNTRSRQPSQRRLSSSHDPFESRPRQAAAPAAFFLPPCPARNARPPARR
jgi:hypothetical protein